MNNSDPFYLNKKLAELFLGDCTDVMSFDLHVKAGEWPTMTVVKAAPHLNQLTGFTEVVTMMENYKVIKDE